MKHFYLFLDESKPSNNLKHFCFGGCIIEKNIYETIIVSRIQKLKTDILKNPSIILHEIDIRTASEMNYQIFRAKEVRDAFWKEMEDIFHEDFYTICSSINTENYNKYYNFKSNRSFDFITLQILLENFTHFLEVNNAKGSIFVESRNSTDDQRLASHYHTLIANGTLYLDKYIFQERLTTINFPLKADNSSGLQIADFIPNPINRELNGLKQKTPTLIDLIKKKLYCGGFGEKDRFGSKNIL